MSPSLLSDPLQKAGFQAITRPGVATDASNILLTLGGALSSMSGRIYLSSSLCVKHPPLLRPLPPCIIPEVINKLQASFGKETRRPRRTAWQVVTST